MTSIDRLDHRAFSRRLSVETAGQLLDFRGGGTSPISEHGAFEQLRGAVAIHNILQEQGVAYLADEVGMGKTYVALGAMALFRHFDPSFRVLVIAPRENIQKKWLKELKNFVARNVRFPDLRMKAVHGAPARATVFCGSLVEMVREATVDPDRDFFARLSSFSLPLGKDSDRWIRQRDGILEHLPWLDPSLFDLRSREMFKDNFARAVNCVLPRFDLVIVDEGHNLKGGFRAGAASRNRVLALAFGHPSERPEAHTPFRGYGKRASRVLFLSATPLENDYVQLWNQLDVFGHGGGSNTLLRQDSASDEEKRERTGTFLIRRVTTLPVDGQMLTKNLYRREWRKGGVSTHDEPLETPTEMQRLAVALIQKKVSEVLGAAKFNNCFQIGMLASFESFLETAKIRSKDADETGNFDDAEQTDDPESRRGADVSSINNLARSHRRRFNSELPHPKMDAVVGQLGAAFSTGEKALVFVRRVASVRELQRKLEECYDSYLFDRLRSELLPDMQSDLEEVIRQYREQRATETLRRTPRPIADVELEEEAVIEETPMDDQGGLDSFFAWFFRGDGPGGSILSGATLQRRFSQSGSVSSTFFEDNHVAWLLGATPGTVTAALAEYLGESLSELTGRLEADAGARLPRVKRQQRRNVFLAFQAAAISLLAVRDGAIRGRAHVVYSERFATGELAVKGAAEPPALAEWLEQATFWTGLRERPGLKEALWPAPTTTDERAAFREQELRRELFSAMARLGHPFVDLFVLSVNRIGQLRMRAREQEDERSDLAGDFLDLLAKQATQNESTHSSYRELLEAARNFDLVITVNEPGVRTEPLDSAATLFGRLLRAQQPIGGMSGQVNETLVRQFRMPGYPLILITTDLLQEGEDLHTFCSTVHHYGISWMPSSMEQRVGRVDRVSSQTDRRLVSGGRTGDGRDLLQVYYPHLQDTVEVLQVRRVLERLNRFTRLMHESLGSHETESRSLDVTTEILRIDRDIEQLREPLRTAFPISDHMLHAPERPLAVEQSVAQALTARFEAIFDQLRMKADIDCEARTATNALFGTMRLRTRNQPFTLLLRSVDGRPSVRCVSPIGLLGTGLNQEDVDRAVRGSGVRIGSVYNQTLESYDLTIEGDVLLGDPAADTGRIAWLLHRVTSVADQLELSLLEVDEPMGTFRADLGLEATYER